MFDNEELSLARLKRVFVSSLCSWAILVVILFFFFLAVFSANEGVCGYILLQMKVSIKLLELPIYDPCTI